MYLSIFEDADDILKEYKAPDDALNGAIIHIAWYGVGSYEGASLVVFEKDGKLYEVNGSHCSCYGLEGQWEPQETSWEALGIRNYFYHYYDAGDEAVEELEKLVQEHVPNIEEIRSQLKEEAEKKKTQKKEEEANKAKQREKEKAANRVKAAQEAAARAIEYAEKLQAEFEGKAGITSLSSLPIPIGRRFR